MSIWRKVNRLFNSNSTENTRSDENLNITDNNTVNGNQASQPTTDEADHAKETNTGDGKAQEAAKSVDKSVATNATGEDKDGKKEEKFEKSEIYNLIIVDESGSMSHLRESTLSGINETINTIREAQKQYADTQEHYLTLVTFDSGNMRPDVRTIIDRAPIAEVKDFKDYCPNGCTPLYDAMGDSITRLAAHIAKRPNATALVTVLTDGLENSSKEWNARSVRLLIEKYKEMGWSFSYMGSAHNVKEVTDLLNIDNVMEFDHSIMGSANTWKRERGSKMSYYRKMALMEREERRSGRMSHDEKMARKRKFAEEYYGDRVTPYRVDRLGMNEIFVFGSNAQGNHTGGAARVAVERFGAVMGQGEGLQGQSYAIPTMGTMEEIKAAVNRFIAFAESHPEMRFLVTRIGCGVAGHSVTEIAPLFENCIKLENVALPIDFWKVLGITMNL